MTTLTYTLKYQVLADSRLAAIMQAGGKVRTGVRVVELLYAEPGLPGWYDVGLSVEEDLPDSVQSDIAFAVADMVRWGA